MTTNAVPLVAASPLRILIADDHEVVRQGTRVLIEREPGWEICGVAANGRDAVAMAESLQPDVVVLDMSLPGLNGLEATRQIRRRCPRTEVLLFSAHSTDDLLRRVFEAGAKSYILKSDAGRHLVDAIRALGRHKTFFTEDASRVVFARFNGPRPPAENGHESLSSRERELLQLLAEGKSNKEAAADLGISPRTAEVHRAALMRKLDVESLAGLVRYAVRNGIISA